MSQKAKQHKFHVSVSITGDFDIPVQAETLEQAIASVRSLGDWERIKKLNSWNDYRTDVTGAWKES